MDRTGGHSGRIRRWIAGLLGVADRHNKAFGARGEKIAERYLKRRGYRIVTRNFRAVGAEIDLVAMDGAIVVFVEVKTRRGQGAGTPQDSVDERKQRQLRRAAEVFTARYRAGDRAMRFD
ncbi:MAG: YraN family protein, partial [Candidatus Binataceae bacterium]